MANKSSGMPAMLFLRMWGVHSMSRRDDDFVVRLERKGLMPFVDTGCARLAGQSNVASGADDGGVEAVVDGHQFHPRRFIGDGGVVATTENDAFRHTIAVSISMPAAPVRPEDVLPRVVVYDAAVQPACDAFPVAKRVPLKFSFLPFAMERRELNSK